MSTLYDPKNQLAPTPPMGWNSYNAFGGMHGLPADTNPALPGGVALEERLIFETADAMVSSGLRDAGYVYLNIDDRWQDPRQPRDAQGRLRPDIRRFPNGMKVIADYLHDRGLKFGLYTVANVFACGGEEGDGPNGFPSSGSLGNEKVDAASFADWEIDFLKIDWCGVDEASNRGQAATVFRNWNDAIAATGRGIALSASTWGEEAEDQWAPELCHMWRTTADLHATWDSILSIAHANSEERWRKVSGPISGWNDPDMMHVGHPGLTFAESRAHLVLWAMMSAPLLTGHDIRTQSEEIRSLLLCPDIIAIDRDPAPAAQVEHHEDQWDVWTRPLSDGRTAHAVVNLAEHERELPHQLVKPGREVMGGLRASTAPPVVGSHDVRMTIE